MEAKYFEDLEVGDKFTTSCRTITETEIINFVGLSGIINPLFLDEEFAKKSLYQSRIAPGPLTFILAMGLITQLGIFEGTMLAFLGLDKMRLTAPVKPGDTIGVEMEITGKRETKAPDRGIINERFTVRNQKGETVITYEMTHLLARKGREPQ